MQVLVNNKMIKTNAGHWLCVLGQKICLGLCHIPPSLLPEESVVRHTCTFIVGEYVRTPVK